MRVWIFTRLAFIVIAAVAGFFLDISHPWSPPTISRDLAIAFIGGAVCVLSWGTWLQMMAPIFTRAWLRPSWRLNPFNFRQPLQFVHLFAHTCLAFGLVVFARGAVSTVPISVDDSAFLMFGAGLWAGLHIFILLFLRKVEHDT